MLESICSNTIGADPAVMLVGHNSAASFLSSIFVIFGIATIFTPFSVSIPLYAACADQYEN